MGGFGFGSDISVGRSGTYNMAVKSKYKKNRKCTAAEEDENRRGGGFPGKRDVHVNFPFYKYLQ